MKFAKRSADAVVDEPKLQLIWGVVMELIFSFISVGHWYFSGRTIGLFLMLPLIGVGAYLIVCGVIGIKEGDVN